MKHCMRMVLAALSLAGAGWAGAATVTYTFTEYGDNGAIAYQLRHSLDHFLASGEELSFVLGDIVVDPQGAGGTLALQQYASSDLPRFGASGNFITFAGAVFCDVLPGIGQGCDPGHRFEAQSYDMQVTPQSAGTWTDSSQTGFREQLDVSVGPDRGRVPEPATLALLAGSLMALALRRRRN